MKHGLLGKAFKEQDLSSADMADFAGLDYDLTERFLRTGCSWKYLERGGGDRGQQELRASASRVAQRPAGRRRAAAHFLR